MRNVSVVEVNPDPIRVIEPRNSAEAIAWGKECLEQKCQTGRRTQRRQDLLARRAWEVSQEPGATVTRRQRGEDFVHGVSSLSHPRQDAMDRQERIARGQRGERTARTFDIGTCHETPIRFPPANPGSAFGTRFVHAFDDIRRSDAGLGFEHGGERSAIDRIVATDRHYDGFGAQIFRDDHADQIAPEKLRTRLVCARIVEPDQQRSIAVTIGRHERIKALPAAACVMRQSLDRREHRVIDCFGVDRHKGVATSNRHDFGTDLLQRFHQQIASDS